MEIVVHLDVRKKKEFEGLGSWGFKVKKDLGENLGKVRNNT